MLDIRREELWVWLNGCGKNQLPVDIYKLARAVFYPKQFVADIVRQFLYD